MAQLADENGGTQRFSVQGSVFINGEPWIRGEGEDLQFHTSLKRNNCNG